MKSSLILILDRSESMSDDPPALGGIGIARELGIRVARAFFSSQNSAKGQQGEEVYLIIFDDQIICESFSRCVDLESFLNNEDKFYARGGTDFIPAL